MDVMEEDDDIPKDFNVENNNDLVQVEISRKPFIGGYRHKKTGVEYHHASSQTLPTKGKQNETAPPKPAKVNSSNQATPSKNKYQQTDIEVGTQTEIRVLFWIDDNLQQGGQIRKRGERELTACARNYRCAEEFETVKNVQATIIQRAFRRWLKTRNVVKAKRSFLDQEQGGTSFESQEEEEDVNEDENEEAPYEVEGGAEEYDKEAYRQMLAELESRHKEETARIVVEDPLTIRRKKSKVVAAAALQMAKEAAAKQQQRLADGEALMAQLVVKAGQPRVWLTSRKRPVEVETPTTQRAKALADVYVQLVDTHESEQFDERATALKAVIDILDSLWDCPEKRELFSLIAREADFVNRDVKVQNLSGLRRRITSAFLRIIRSPDFNPEISRFEMHLPRLLVLSQPRGSKSLGQHGRKGSLVPRVPERCLGCLQHLPLGRFPLSSGSFVGRCLNCERLELAARARQGIGVFKAMLENIRRAEEEQGNTTSPVFQLQDSDIRYIVENFWDSQSSLSGASDLNDLNLVRWDRNEEWSPWNCVLLSQEEVVIHSNMDNPIETYGAQFIQKTKLKHTLARNHFSKMSTMAKYFSSQGEEEDGVTQLSLQGKNITRRLSNGDVNRNT